MSKKLAIGLDASGARRKKSAPAGFMKTPGGGRRRLAQMMVGIGPPRRQARTGADHRYETSRSATPSVNALEVMEVVAGRCKKRRSPPISRALSLELAARMIYLGQGPPRRFDESPRARAEENCFDGSGYRKTQGK